jgi:TM2 domain-containing membrane protein YozV
MSMYRIIGADGRQYGPATADQIRQWLAEGRATAQTMAQADGGQWQALGAFPEFAGASSAPPIAAAPPPVIGSNLKSRIAAGLLGVFIGGLGIHRFYLGYTSIGVAQILVTFFTCGMGSLWGFIEGICILASAAITTDAEGRPMRD